MTGPTSYSDNNLTHSDLIVNVKYDTTPQNQPQYNNMWGHAKRKTLSIRRIFQVIFNDDEYLYISIFMEHIYVLVPYTHDF